MNPYIEALRDLDYIKSAADLTDAEKRAAALELRSGLPPELLSGHYPKTREMVKNRYTVFIEELSNNDRNTRGTEETRASQAACEVPELLPEEPGVQRLPEVTRDAGEENGRPKAVVRGKRR